MPGKVKGVNIVALVKLLRKAGMETAMKVVPPAHQHYLQERILVSNRYPEIDHVELLRALHRLMPPKPEPWIVMGRQSAATDLKGVYKAHLRPGDPVRTLQSSGALWRNYHDSGDVTVSFPSERSALVELRNFVAPARELCRINVGYFESTVLLAGAREARCVERGCVVEGATECSWTIDWTM
ncbi:MAG TPA: hypothetical protein VF334_12635 [Polyangia bacterium]